MPVERVTAPETIKKEKNPNRVAAGKKLAEYNKKKKQEINKTEKVPKPEKKEPIEASSGSLLNHYWIYGGVGVGVAFIFYNSFKNGMKHERSKAPRVESPVVREESFDME